MNVEIIASTRFRHNFNSIRIIHPCCSPVAVACPEVGGQTPAGPASTAAAHVVGAVQAHVGRGCAAGGVLEDGPEAGVESPWAAHMEGPEIVWLKWAKKLCFFCNSHLFFKLK